MLASPEKRRTTWGAKSGGQSRPASSESAEQLLLQGQVWLGRGHTPFGELIKTHGGGTSNNMKGQ